jgi:hypothetical protein
MHAQRCLLPRVSDSNSKSDLGVNGSLFFCTGFCTVMAPSSEIIRNTNQQHREIVRIYLPRKAKYKLMSAPGLFSE